MADLLKISQFVLRISWYHQNIRKAGDWSKNEVKTIGPIIALFFLIPPSPHLGKILKEEGCSNLMTFKFKAKDVMIKNCIVHFPNWKWLWSWNHKEMTHALNHKFQEVNKFIPLVWILELKIVSKKNSQNK